MSEDLKKQAWTCRICGAAFLCTQEQTENRMAHHLENHRVTAEGLDAPQERDK